jgi:hypothetical protein
MADDFDFAKTYGSPTASGSGQTSQDFDFAKTYGKSTTEQKPAAAQPPVDTWEDVKKGAISGGIRGTAALAGLPGDIGAGGRWLYEENKKKVLDLAENLGYADKGSADAYRKQIEQERNAPERNYVGPVPRSEITTRYAEEQFPEAKYKPVTMPGKITHVLAEAVPSALIPVGEAGLASRLGMAGVSALGSEAAGQFAETNAPSLEPAARVIGAFASPYAASKTVAPVFNSLTNSEKVAFDTLVKQGASDIKAGRNASLLPDQIAQIVADEKANGVPQSVSILRGADLLADSPSDLIKAHVKNVTTSPAIKEEAQRVMQGVNERALASRSWVADELGKNVQANTENVVNGLRTRNNLPELVNPTFDEIQQTAKSIKDARNSALYQAAYTHQDIMNPTLNKVLNTPAGIEAAVNAENKYINSVASTGQTPTKLFDITKSPTSGLNQVDLRGTNGLPMEFWHYFEQELRSGKPDVITGRLRDQFQKGIAEYFSGPTGPSTINPYTRAQSAAAQGFGEMDAFNAGQNFFRDSKNLYDPKKRADFIQKFNQLTPEEKTLASAGQSRAMQELVDSDGGRNILTKMLKDPDVSRVTQKLMDWNVPPGQPSNFEKFKNTMDIYNATNKMDRADFLARQPQVSSWLANHPVWSGLGGSAAFEAAQTIASLQFFANPILTGSTGLTFWGYNALKKIGDDKVAMQILKILDSRDPQMLSRLSEEIQQNGKVRNSFQKATRFLDLTDKKVQEEYMKASRYYTPQQARNIESQENKAGGGAVSRAIPVIKQLTQPIMPKTHYNHGGIVIQSHSK